MYLFLFFCVFSYICIEVVNGNPEKTTVVSMPYIKSPIVFLVVNFLFFYAIFVIIICLYELYECPETNRILKFGGISAESNEYAIATDLSNLSDVTSATHATDESYLQTNNNNNCSSLLLSELPKSDFTEYESSWTGDWNTFWNSKCDY